MTKVLLSLHVLAAILAIGPIAVAASLFPRYAQPGRRRDVQEGRRYEGVARLLHRICRGYAVVGAAVPAFGVATGAAMGVLGDAWLMASVILTAIAAAILILVILPGQQELLAAPMGADGMNAEPDRGTEAARTASRLTMLTGVFNLLWATVTVLMIVRPGA
ncbi:DUF2269 family protein [Streptomyces oceani]|uniref:Uncharacterized protein n=1 Tax=Streptomyces oceani TaxID=1075402 RepID=A0A1E7KGG0_9ACTN|nr:DUF2269 family protein [Streptomyces oceani]OEV03001.1 hypothetical protein AN216_13605 [Streptomyces oceani]